MAEAFAIVGLAAAISQFVTQGTRIFERMKEFNTNVKEVPETFRAITTELPLLVDILRRTKRQAEKGDISKNTQQALEPVVESCVEQVEVLDAILAKVLPATGDSSWNRWRKALSSVRMEKQIDKIIMTLRNYVQILTYHQATGFVVSKEYLETVAGSPTSETADVVTISGNDVAVIPMAHGRFDAYAAGSDGAVYVFPLEELEQQKTTRWKRLGDLQVATLTGVAAVFTSKETLVVCVRDPNGRLCIIVGQVGLKHHHSWRQVGSAIATGFDDSPVTLISRADEEVEAFVIGRDNRVWTLEYDLRKGIDKGWHVIGDLKVPPYT